MKRCAEGVVRPCGRTRRTCDRPVPDGFPGFRTRLVPGSTGVRTPHVRRPRTLRPPRDSRLS